MLTLNVAVVGSDRIAVVDMDENWLVTELQESVAAEVPELLSALNLRLYSTKQSGGHEPQWLSSEAASFERLQRPDCPVDSPYLSKERELMPASLVTRYFTRGMPIAGVIHVLARLLTVDSMRSGSLGQTEGSLSRSLWSLKRPSLSIPWVLEPEECPQLAYGASLFLSIPWHYLNHSGVKGAKANRSLWIYRRQALDEQWNEMERDSIDARAMLWIVGAPGAGKSCAAYAFACGVVDRTQWNVLWIHSKAAKKRFHCVKFEGGEKSTCTLHADTTSWTMLLSSIAADRDLFAILDDYREDGQEGPCHRLRVQLARWQSADRAHRGFVCVTSMLSLGKDFKLSDCDRLDAPHPIRPSRQNGHIHLFDAMQFELWSWTLDEYLAAVEHKQFFGSVMPAFDVDADPSVIGRRELVHNKYYVAGGNAQMMFVDTTERARTALRRAMTALWGFRSIVDGSSDRASLSAGNRLIAHYDVDDDNLHQCWSSTVTSTVSPFVSRHLVLDRVGPGLLLNFMQRIHGYQSKDGYLFEAWVLSSLGHQALEGRVRSNDRNVPDTPMRWEQRPVVSFDPLGDAITDAGCYYLPDKWTQAGYDAVYIESDETTTSRYRYVFLQITSATTHSFSAKPFLNVLDMLGGNKDSVGAVELWFVVPLEILKQFSTSEVDEPMFRKDVVDVAFPGQRLHDATTRQIDCAVRCVGVDNQRDLSY